MYKDYIKEREDLDTHETEFGFICYRIHLHTLWINDYYVKPEFRMSGRGKELADHVFNLAKEAGCTDAYCQSDSETNNHEISKTAISNFGFKPIKVVANLIYYHLEVSEWEKRLAV